jgi:hypothetical protein
MVALLLLALMFAFSMTARAQVAAVDVFLQQNADGTAELIFIDLATAEDTRLTVTGERFTTLTDSVLYFDPTSRRVMRATPDGRTEPHPFLLLSTGDTRIDWVIDASSAHIGWTLTQNLAPGVISTVTRVSDIDGANTRTLLTEQRTDSLRAKPVAFDISATTLYMDYQPDGLDGLLIFPQYAGLFALDTETARDLTASTDFLAGEPADFTGAGFGAGWFIRLAVRDGLGGFDLRVTNLDSEREWDIPAVQMPNYTLAGDFLISPDGRYAAYVLAALGGVGSGRNSVQSVIMQVNLGTMIQTTLTGPHDTILHPVRWTEDDTALILVDARQGGTFKVRPGGNLLRLSDSQYLGTIEGS